MNAKAKLSQWANPKTLALLLVVAVNAAHPFIHAFEGGGLDVWLVYLDHWIMQTDPFIPSINMPWRHTHE